MIRLTLAVLACAALTACVSETDTDTAALGGVLPQDCPAPKVLVCHIPPGNPANAHNICISANAVDTHLTQHGDFVGDCACPEGGECGGEGGPN